MERFWELFEQSVITQAVITFFLILTVCIIFVQGKSVPNDLMLLTTTVLGFWFGSKVGYRQGETKVIQTIKKRATDVTDQR